MRRRWYSIVNVILNRMLDFHFDLIYHRMTIIKDVDFGLVFQVGWVILRSMKGSK